MDSSTAAPTAVPTEDNSQLSEVDPKPLSKKKQKSVAKKSISTEGTTQLSVDCRVQHTNDDSILSKRSAAQLGYIDDPYLRHFVKKPSRRAPLINRGYYLRIAAMTEMVEHCLLKMIAVGAAPHVQVVSLGAGFDTLAARLYNRPEYQSVHFFEVDFPDVMANKAGLFRCAPPHSFPYEELTSPAKDPRTLVCNRYAALGLDLRTCASALLPLLGAHGFDVSAPTVVYAECVMQYMEPEVSTGIVEWVAKALPNAIFMAYDQINPYDSFGGVMRRSLAGKYSPLQCIALYPGGREMCRRAQASGFVDVRYCNFHDLARFHISGAERSRVEALETFDEYEEWAEKCEHYGILFASTATCSFAVPPHPALRPAAEVESFDCVPPGVAPSAASPVSPATPLPQSTGGPSDLSLQPWPNARFHIDEYGGGGVSIEYVDDIPILLSFGGASLSKGVARSNTLSAHSMRDGEVRVSVIGNPPSERIFHSFTRLGPWRYAVFGGRTNPSKALNDACLCVVTPVRASGSVALKVSWTPLQPADNVVPAMRFRHNAALVSSQSNTIFVHGGKDGAGSILGDAFIGTIDDDARQIKWTPCPLKGDALPPLCSSAVTVMPDAPGTILISGGMSGPADTSANTYALTFCDDDGARCRVLPFSIGRSGRFSHAVAPLQPSMTRDGQWALLVHGGSVFQPKCAEDWLPPLIVRDPLGPTPTVERLSVPAGGSAVTSVRHSVLPLRWRGADMFAFVGGSFTCFSFGNFTPKPYLLLLKEVTDTTRAAFIGAAAVLATRVVLSPAPAIPPLRQELYSAAEWRRALSETEPIVLRRCPLGPCVDKWRSVDYLKSTTKQTQVAVHVADTGMLDFVHKNFDFRHVSFGDLVQHCFGEDDGAQSETWYFRSVGANMLTERSNFFKDFPHIAPDFVLPAEVSEVVLHPTLLHQSCLRVNQAGMRLWPHYDVTDNILCNVVGRKRVLLFPCTQYNNLYMSGSSSPVLDPADPDLHRFPLALEALYSAREVILEAGDVLIIPGLWIHHVTALDASISVNLFYKRPSMVGLSQPPQAGGTSTTATAAASPTAAADPYDPKDLYANKDLPWAAGAHAHLMAEVHRVAQAAPANIPPEYKAMMLQQLMRSIGQLAEEFAIASGHTNAV